MLVGLLNMFRRNKMWNLMRTLFSRMNANVMDTITIEEIKPKKELSGKIGLLLVNTGTPSGYSYLPMRQYLREFLSDPRVIEMSPLFWKPILHLCILTTRPFTKGKQYKSIWNLELDESPLRTITRNQAEYLTNRFREHPVIVDWAFRYGEPSIADKIQSLEKQGSRCDKLVLFPLYPQFSAVTSASVFDECCRRLMVQRHQMALSVIPPFFGNDSYVNAIAGRLDAALCELKILPEIIIVSYHGIPLSYQLNGDPYGFQCKHTTSLLSKNLRILKCEMLTTFQSRFGSGRWLKPYTEDTVIQLAKCGVKRIMVIAPGFISDCLETIQELGHDLAESFRKNGGKEYVYVPSLNDSIDAIDLMESLSRKHIQCFL